MRRCFFWVILSLFMALSGQAQVFKPLPPADLAAVKKVMADQEAAWNRGDIDAFMKGYLPSDEIRFIGKNGVTYGYDDLLQRYRTGYPDRAAMGKLTFTLIHTDLLEKKTAWVIGKWEISRGEAGSEVIGGHFSLLFKKIKGNWIIIADHTS